MSNKKQVIRYDRLVEDALRGVVKASIRHVQQHGLGNGHHFYISFKTGYPDVVVPEYLLARYPDEMTIVLQHQFYDIEIDDYIFKVTLSFDNVPERLEVPFGAITVFADPSVNFVLQFQPADVQEGGGGGMQSTRELSKEGVEFEEREFKKGKVISFDAWKKR